MSQFFSSGGQSIGVSALVSVLPVNIQDLFPFRIDWFDFLAVQGNLKSLLQHHSSKASVLWHSAFFMVHSHIGTWLPEKPKWTFVDEVMSLLFRTLSRFFIAFFKVKVLVAKPCPTLC